MDMPSVKYVVLTLPFLMVGALTLKNTLVQKKHETQSSLKAQTTSVSSFFKPSSSEDQSVIKAEALFIKFLIEHNIPLAASDHARGLFRAMFAESKVADQYHCGRTKSTAIAECLADEITKNLAKIMQENPFSLATDGSNDNDSTQLYPLVIRYFNDELGKVVSELLCISSCGGASTGENIFKILDKQFKFYGIPWQNCVSFGCDNASVMVGKHKGVAAFIKRENENVIIQGCACHLLHISAKNANNKLSVSVDDILIDIFFYFAKSSKRQQEFQRFQTENGLILHKILKHGPTRWLSLSECVNRLLEQWPALCDYFNKESDSSGNDRMGRIVSFFKNPVSKLYCLFLQNALPMFISANVFLQKEDPEIHKMQEAIQNIYIDLLVRFVKPKVIANCANIFEVAHQEKANQKHRQDVMLGKKVRDELNNLKDDKKITADEETLFFNDVRAFFSEACHYLTTSLPLQDKTLAHCQILNFKDRLKHSFNNVEFFVKKFQFISADERDQLESEFLKFQVEACFPPEIEEETRIDIAWSLIGKMKDSEGKRKYGLLSKVMLAVCVIPHSNATSERIFSLVRKAKTEFRASMSVKVLSAIMVQRVSMIARGEVCYSTSFTREELRKAKSACFNALSKGGSA